MRFRISPEDILKNIGISFPEEVDLELIAFSLNAEVKYQPLGDCEGYIIGTNERSIITINNNASYERQRFSLGHELGHWVNDKGKNLTYRCTSDDMNQYNSGGSNLRQQREVRANQFSAQLIMPEYLLKPRLLGSPISIETSKKIAGTFGSSVTSASIRLIEITEYPCMLCCWAPTGIRRWFIRSETLSECIWPLKRIIHPRDLLYESNNSDVDGDKWLEGEEVELFTIRESVFFNGFDWLTLLWWQDESQLQ